MHGKRRFLRSAVGVVEIAEIRSAIEYPEFDVAMLCTSHAKILRSCLSHINDEIATIKERDY